jgi:hypothetical protein
MDQILACLDSPAPASAASDSGENVAFDNRREIHGRILGRLVELSGLHAVIVSNMGASPGEAQWSVGHLITIAYGESRIIAVVCSLSAMDQRWTDNESNVVHVTVELTGEIVTGPNGKSEFRRGLQSYPPLGAIAHRIRTADLAAIYAFRHTDGVEIGRLSQNDSIPAVISVGQAKIKQTVRKRPADIDGCRKPAREGPFRDLIAKDRVQRLQ